MAPLDTWQGNRFLLTLGECPIIHYTSYHLATLALTLNEIQAICMCFVKLARWPCGRAAAPVSSRRQTFSQTIKCMRLVYVSKQENAKGSVSTSEITSLKLHVPIFISLHLKKMVCCPFKTNRLYFGWIYLNLISLAQDFFHQGSFSSPLSQPFYFLMTVQKCF